jgi:hypothetical protein
MWVARVIEPPLALMVPAEAPLERGRGGAKRPLPTYPHTDNQCRVQLYYALVRYAFHIPTPRRRRRTNLKRSVALTISWYRIPVSLAGTKSTGNYPNEILAGIWARSIELLEVHPARECGSGVAHCAECRMVHATGPACARVPAYTAHSVFPQAACWRPEDTMSLLPFRRS